MTMGGQGLSKGGRKFQKKRSLSGSDCGRNRPILPYIQPLVAIFRSAHVLAFLMHMPAVGAAFLSPVCFQQTKEKS
jgi:hypothetical protein